MKRRTFTTLAATGALSVMAASCTKGSDRPMYGLLGQMIAAEGQRDALISILLAGTRDMPGCISYVIAQDQEDQNALWITEIWQDKESHAASLILPAVQQAIAEGKPLIAGFGHRFETTPIGGHGLPGTS